jgi:2-polyprenyl-6-methoxyphenol hydroxylase-like FAD-dependent oxidoreductase
MDVAIIGAGLSGLAMALALHQQSIPCTIYEARETSLNIGGAVMLMPNGLKALDKLGVYDSLKKRGYNFDRIYIQNAESRRIVETVEYGSEQRYGYQALRIYRSAVIGELLAAVKVKGIPIHFNRKFDHIVCETANNVTWKFKDDSTATASFLIGADGIHSAVRSYLAPDIKPAFAHMAAIVAAVPTAQLELPKNPGTANLNDPSNDYPIPSGLVVPRLGAFVIAPQTHNGDEVMITVQRRMTLEEAANSNKDHLRSLLRQNSECFPTIVQNAVRNIPTEKLIHWPFYHIPRLERWTSSQVPGGFGRVAIVGDSAHAIPPSAGQGVNLGFEDAYILALVLGRMLASGHSSSHEALDRVLLGWQKSRQMQVDRVLEHNKQMDLRRMPAASDAGDEGEEKLDMEVMFERIMNIDFEEAADQCMQGLDVIA